MKIRTCMEGWTIGLLCIVGGVIFTLVHPIGLIFIVTGVAVVIADHIAHWLWD